MSTWPGGRCAKFHQCGGLEVLHIQRFRGMSFTGNLRRPIIVVAITTVFSCTLSAREIGKSPLQHVCGRMIQTANTGLQSRTSPHHFNIAGPPSAWQGNIPPCCTHGVCHLQSLPRHSHPLLAAISGYEWTCLSSTLHNSACIRVCTKFSSGTKSRGPTKPPL